MATLSFARVASLAARAGPLASPRGSTALGGDSAAGGGGEDLRPPFLEGSFSNKLWMGAWGLRGAAGAAEFSQIYAKRQHLYINT